MTTTAKSILFMTTWKKYLPFIRVLMKKSITGEQTLCMNRIDFERGGRSKKWGYNFVISFVNRRPAPTAGDDEFARAFIDVMQDDAIVSGHIGAGDYSFSLNNKYELTIKNISVTAASAARVQMKASSV